MFPKTTLAILLVICFTSAIFPFQKDKAEDEKVRMVQGLVTDADDKPIVGAVVQLKSAKSLPRSFITQEKGTYQFHGLDPNVDYTLKAEFKGVSSASKTLSSFDSHKQPIINIKIEVRK